MPVSDREPATVSSASHVQLIPVARRGRADNAVENCTKDNFPLVFSEVELVIREAPENLEFIQRFLPKLEWNALVDTARSVSHCLIRYRS
jgi:hypothetical protein